MLGQFGFVLPEHYIKILPHSFTEILLKLGIQFSHVNGYGGKNQIIVLIMLLFFVFKLPNTQEIFQKYRPILGQNKNEYSTFLKWEPTLKSSIIIGIIFSYLLLFLS